MNKIVITNFFNGLTAMNVCVEDGTTDQEILDYVNIHNKAGTTNGWMTVVRNEEDLGYLSKSALPCKCNDYPNRTHFLIYC